MSRRTIRVVDLLCDVGNWNDSIECNKQTIAELGPDSRWIPECNDEIARWSKKRDRALQKLRDVVASLTADDLDLIRRKYRPETLAMQLREIGVESRWESANA